MIRFKMTNGTIVEIDSGEELSAPIMNAILGTQVTFPLTNATTIAPAATGVDDEAEADHDGEKIAVFAKTGKRGRTRIHTQNPPVPAGRWPDLFYITKEGLETVNLLREYPEGLTGDEITIGLGLTGNLGAGRVARLRRFSPLVSVNNDNVYRLTMIGADLSLKFEIAVNPSPKNKKIGWDRFMARELPSGRHQRRRP